MVGRPLGEVVAPGIELTSVARSLRIGGEYALDRAGPLVDALKQLEIPGSRDTRVFANQVGAINLGGPSRHTPLGFSNADEFLEFGNALYSGLGRAGFDDVQAIFQGSSVTGRSFITGNAFDAGRISDYDIALASEDLLERAKAVGVGIRGRGTRTEPLGLLDTPHLLRHLGLDDLSRQLLQQTGRPVNFMIYGSVDTAVGRSPSILVPRPGI